MDLAVKDIFAVTLAVVVGLVFIAAVIYAYIYCTRMRPKRHRQDEEVNRPREYTSSNPSTSEQQQQNGGGTMYPFLMIGRYMKKYRSDH